MRRVIARGDGISIFSSKVGLLMVKEVSEDRYPHMGACLFIPYFPTKGSPSSQSTPSVLSCLPTAVGNDPAHFDLSLTKSQPVKGHNFSGGWLVQHLQELCLTFLSGLTCFCCLICHKHLFWLSSLGGWPAVGYNDFDKQRCSLGSEPHVFFDFMPTQ
ncbi:uncharacterized protein [Elaeis guineensis]|uniref:uncharacterized protein isoform X5 n=1 Tax=Elaeis guineensis var. tenera TaxID=51953 RepID=UPI003C6D9295